MDKKKLDSYRKIVYTLANNLTFEEFCEVMPMEVEEEIIEDNSAELDIVNRIVELSKFDDCEKTGKSHERGKVIFRQLIHYSLNKIIPMSPQKIAEKYDKDRTTILHSIKHIQNMLDTNDELLNEYRFFIDEWLK